MRFLVDECFPKRFVTALRDKGHDVTWAGEVCRSEIDSVVLALATSENRIVITEDQDYGNLALRDGCPAVGVVIARTDQFIGGLPEVIEAVCLRVNSLGTSLLGTITIIEPGRIRQRTLPGDQS